MKVGFGTKDVGILRGERGGGGNHYAKFIITFNHNM
jgi:hypothetical protein